MSKSMVNFLVDSVMFVAIILLSATGALMRYVLPPGSGHFSQLWKMDRHQWGQIHFWIAVVLMSTVALHLLLHWNWVVCMVKGRPGNSRRYPRSPNTTFVNCSALCFQVSRGMLSDCGALLCLSSSRQFRTQSANDRGRGPLK
jgi:hypothetical protein